jgi:hypothetical protein
MPEDNATEPTQTLPAKDGDIETNPRSENTAHVLDISRETLAFEFQRANRWDEKARGQASLAGAWLAVTQAVAAVALGPQANGGWVVVAAIGLALQAAAFVMTLVRSAAVWKPRERNEFGSETLDALEGRLNEPTASVAKALFDFYKGVLDEAQQGNEDRGKKFEKAMFWWWFVLGIGVIEIGVALLSRA